jgi:hypothetical protein
MDIYPEDETFYPTQYQEVCLKYLETEYWAKHRCLLVNKHESLGSSNLVQSVTASGSSESSFDAHDLFRDNEEYIRPNNVYEATPGWSDRTAHLLTATRLYLNSLPEASQYRGQIHPYPNDYHSNPMQISSTSWIPDITDW